MGTDESLRWWHLILTARGAWLHGDPRGFRSRGHRIHSSGDYKNPPPRGEHAGLHEWHRARSGPGVSFPVDVREMIGRAILLKCRKAERRVLAIAVAPAHAHLLVELSRGRQAAEAFCGRLKQASSHAVRDRLPGSVWAGGGKPVDIEDRSHHRRVFDYILAHSSHGAWTWDFRGAAECR